MNKKVKRIFKTIFLVLLYAFLAFFIYCIFTRPTINNSTGSFIINGYSKLDIDAGGMLFTATVSYYWDDNKSDMKTIKSNRLDISDSIPAAPGEHVLHYYLNGKITRWWSNTLTVPDEATQKELQDIEKSTKQLENEKAQLAQEEDQLTLKSSEIMKRLYSIK